MASPNNLQQWIEGAFANLPINSDSVFTQLWKRGRISFKSNSIIDHVDESNAALISTALNQKENLLLVHPDMEPHRGPLPLGTALALDAMRSYNEQQPGNRVLLFSNKASLKYTLSEITIGNMSLDEVFSQTDIGGRYNRHENYQRRDMEAQYLPDVICIYRPVRPEEFIKIYGPNWIAVDCGNSLEIEWLSPLMESALNKNIPVIAWCHNSFSNAIEIFTRFGHVYYGPHGLLGQKVEERFTEPVFTLTTPWVITGPGIEDLSRSFAQAQIMLRKMPEFALGPLCRDALSVAWRLLRVLERLTVPVDYYDSQKGGIWRGYSVASLLEALKRYEELTRSDNPKWRTQFSKICHLLQGMATLLSNSKPPLWSALCDFCISPPQSNAITIITFPTRWQKQLFTFVLAAKHGIDEQELEKDCNVLFRTLSQLADPSSLDKEKLKDCDISPVLVGLPGNSRNHELYSVLSTYNCELLLLPHQKGLVDYILDEFNKRDCAETRTSVATLNTLTGDDDHLPSVIPINRFDSSIDHKELSIKLEAKEEDQKKLGNLLTIGSFEEELQNLLQTNEEPEDEEGLVPDPPETTEEASILMEDALCITFSEDYYMLVRNNARLNVYRGDDMKEEYVKGLRKGDVCLVVPNQQRHDLLELILERVTGHPALQFHLQLLEKWRQERAFGFMWWLEKNTAKTLEDFLIAMQNLGCERTSSLTMYCWLEGITLCPRDQKDILRLGQLFDNTFLTDNYKKIYVAAKRLDGIKISVSTRLKHWIANGAKFQDSSENEIIDSELGLTFGDISSSIRILSVRGISQYNEPVLRDEIGRLQKIK